MKVYWQATLFILIGLLAAGIIWLAGSPPRGEPVILRLPPTASPIQIHIIGEIEQPGVYKLARNSRVQDAIEKAGGLTDDADDQTINLAALLEDGQQIHIPAKIQSWSSGESMEGGNPPGRSPTSENPLININTAKLDSLETLPGIGPIIAKEIIDYRENEGNFLSIEEIQKVPRIGPTVYENIKDLITVGEP